MALVNQIDETTTALDIVPQLEMLSTQIDEFYWNTITPMFTRSKATATEKIGYNHAYDNLIADYEALSGSDLQAVNKRVFGYDDQVNRVDWLKTEKKTITPPDNITVKPCNGKCKGFYRDADENKRTCPSCGDEYYTCDTKKAYKHQKLPGSDKYRCEPELSVSLNKSFFYFDEELVVTLKMKDIQSAYLQFAGQDNPRVPSSSPFKYSGGPGRGYRRNTNQVKITTGFSELNFNGLRYWYGDVNITVLYTKADGSNGQTSVSKYIDVEKLGYFAKSTSVRAYGKYEAKVVESEPIKEVYWYIQRPGGGWQGVKHDEVNGGYSSSFSYSLDSTSGTYYVHALVYLDRQDGKIINYFSSFTVD